MSKPIPGKAEVALEYPDTLNIGRFDPTAFDACLDERGISLRLYRIGQANHRSRFACTLILRCLRQFFVILRRLYRPRHRATQRLGIRRYERLQRPFGTH